MTPKTSDIDRVQLALAFPVDKANELLRIIHAVDPAIAVRLVEIDSLQAADQLGFDLRKEALAWAAVTAIGSGVASLTLNVVSNYIYDYVQQQDKAEIAIKDARGGTLYIKQRDAVSATEVEHIIREFLYAQQASIKR